MITTLYNLIQENLVYANLPTFGLVFAGQNMPRLAKPYVVMNVLNIEIPDHMTYGKEINIQGFRKIWGWRKATVELQFYNGIESLTSASLLAMCLQSELSLQSQQKLNCAIGARLYFAYVPEVVNLSQFEGRAIYHFEFFYTEEFNDDVGLIETVIIDGEYSGGATDNVICHEEISVPYSHSETVWDGPPPTQAADDTITDWDRDSTVWDEQDG